ncbi:DNAJ heat shock N-terminal domain-containing-like protein [Hibiscus syriacus]|uniref:DNAJ heat shock N-terminal domain-containing-like protein n=1 Tax=Hibiscus syriacus TaxID=106335 RepID=A0A6A3CQH9_HIBSY|nr:DNAJ heat shock N-terminal domain-containing-like protein [Hibiscus syriacus]
MAAEKHCLYEVLGLYLDCSQDEIRSAYKKLALQRHRPIPRACPRLRSPFRSQRTLLVRLSLLPNPLRRSQRHNSPIPDLFSFFSNTVYSGYSDKGRGFYKVYSELASPYTQVTAFYNYWLGFSTVMDFVWVDEYDVMAGPNRKSRRVMEEENKKLRKKAKREYNETVRGLAEFVKKRDKSVIDMGVKRKEEMERKKEEERNRKKKLEEERLERVKAKKFKSEKQWKNHEQSKKHKEKVAELRESFIDEEEKEGDLEVEPDMEERFRESLKIEMEGEDGVGELSEEDDTFFDVNQVSEERVEFDSDNNHAEEISVLEEMLSSLKDKKNVSFNSEDMVSQTGLHVKDETDEEEYMEYGRQKNRRRNRSGKKDKGKKNISDAMKSDINEAESKNEEASVSDSLHVDKQPVEDESSNGEKDDKLGNNANISKQPLDRKGNTKKELNTKSNKSTKGKKAKATAKHSGNMCYLNGSKSIDETRSAELE